MPSTIDDIFAAAAVSRAGVVRWGTSPAPPTPRTAVATGIYVVALTDRHDSLAGAVATPPVSDAAVDELLAARPELTVDRARPTREQVVQRLGEFWLPDEVVVYIGLAGPRTRRPVDGEVAGRVIEYYDTPLGASRPHAGGWPLKTLARIHDLYVHYGYCERVNQAEDACIAHFAQRVSESTRARLRDPLRVMPFANLELPRGHPKNHGIRGARASKVKRGVKLHLSAPGRPGAPGAPPTPPAGQQPVSAGITPRHRSQNLTAKDIAVGQVRIPAGATKTLFPPVRADVVVNLRGRKLRCRWEPRYGEKERSGVIRVGKSAATDLLAPGDVLAVSGAADGSVRLE